MTNVSICFGSGWEAEKVEGEAANQRRAVGFGGGGQAVFFEFGEDEAVDRVLIPTVEVHRRWGWPFERLECPPGAVLGGEFRRRPRWGVAGGFGPGCAHLDPLLENLDLFGLQFGLGGHPQAVVMDGLDQEALIKFAWHHRRAAISAFEHEGSRIEPQAALLGVGAVTFLAMFGEHRADLQLKESLGRQFLGGANDRGSQRQGQDRNHPEDDPSSGRRHAGVSSIEVGGVRRLTSIQPSS